MGLYAYSIACKQMRGGHQALRAIQVVPSAEGRQSYCSKEGEHHRPGHDQG